MKLGGFVIHGDNAVTIEPCLDSLAAVCDDLVAVDAGSSDGSEAAARARGFRVLRRSWEGYGAARAAAVAELRGCDWILFLDSDEWFEPASIEAIRRFKGAPPAAPRIEFTRNDWAELGGKRFLYRREHHVRLVRADHARWDRSMIVHEALDPGPTASIAAAVEHRFLTDLDEMRAKVNRYALLWALRYHRAGVRKKSPALQRVAHLFRELVLKGSLFTGPREACSIARVIAGYHARKYELLREVSAGRHARLLALLEQDQLGELFRSIETWTPGVAPVRPALASPAGSGEARLEPRPVPVAPRRERGATPGRRAASPP